MCQELKLEMVFNYLFATHDAIKFEQLREIIDSLSTKIEGLLIDYSWHSIVKFQKNNAELFKIEIENHDIILKRIPNKSVFRNKDFLDNFYSSSFKRKDLKIIEKELCYKD